jgi:hypothetical protein
MKKIYLIILAILLVPLTSSLAQTTTIFITNGTALVVPNGAEICADFITVEFGGTYVTANPSGTCAGATVTGGIETETTLPTEFAIYQNYPNPFNPSTKIKYGVPENGNVKLSVYNLVGEEVSVLVDELVEAGFYEVSFNASSLPSGTYFYKLQAGNNIETRKMILLR